MSGPLGPQAPRTMTGGESSFGVPRTLNPLFVEALMGWPTGWTGFDSVETEWCRWLRRMRCELSWLSSPPDGGEPASLFDIQDSIL